MKDLKYIVTGTGRCGTVYFAKLLTSLGIDCGHETIFSYDGIEKIRNRLADKTKLKVSLISEMASVEKSEDWFPNGINHIQADSSYMAAPYLKDELFEGCKIIHLVRHPLKVINSFVYGLGYFRDVCLNKVDFKEYHKFMYDNVPEIYRYRSPLDRAAAYYIGWNRLIEANSIGKPYIRYNISSNLRKVFDFLGIQEPSEFYKNTQSNHLLGLTDKLTCFSQIPSVELREELIAIYKNYFHIKM